MPDTPTAHTDDPLFQMEQARGEARVICFSPDHAKTLPELNEDEIARVVDCWCAQAEELGAHYAHVQLFENKGAMMGCVPTRISTVRLVTGPCARPHPG